MHCLARFSNARDDLGRYARDMTVPVDSTFAPRGIVLGLASLVLDADADPARSREIVRAAASRSLAEGGAVAIDTARAYATVDDETAGEKLAREAVAVRPGIPIITKAGHSRATVSSWDVDGGAERLRRDARLSAEVLGAPPALLLLHRADRVDDVAESVRVLLQLRDEGLAERVGLSNANLEVLESVREIGALDAVQNRLGVGVDSFDEYVYCRDAGIDFLAYAPFGGPRAAPLPTRVPRMSALATARTNAGEPISVHRLVLAAMLDALPGCWPVIGPRRVESALDSLAASAFVVDDDVREAFAADVYSRGVPLPVR